MGKGAGYLRSEQDGSWKEYSDTVWELAIIEILEHNKKDLDRMLGNESHQRTAEVNRKKNKGIE